jgi:hypothetical protein
MVSASGQNRFLIDTEPHLPYIPTRQKARDLPFLFKIDPTFDLDEVENGMLRTEISQTP